MTTETTENVDQLFADAFAQAALDAEKGIQTKAEEPVVIKTPEELAAEQKAADEAAAAQKLVDDAAAKTAADAAKTPEQLAEEQKVADAAAAQTATDDAAAATAAAQKATDDAAAAAKAAEETPEAKAAKAALEESLKPYEFTEQEKAAIEKMKVDFPGEYEAMTAHFKATDRDINARVHKAIQEVLHRVYADITPVVQGYSADAVEKHFTTLRAAHADYDAVVGLIPAWIKTQPAYLQPAMQAAYDEGDTQSVVDLVATFKAATGRTVAAETPAQLAAKQAAIDAAAAKVKAAADDAANLAPVGAKRTNTAPKGAPDKADYDGAFAEAAAAAEAAAKR